MEGAKVGGRDGDNKATGREGIKEFERKEIKQKGGRVGGREGGRQGGSKGEDQGG